MHDPAASAQELEKLGVRIALFPGLVLQTAVAAMREALSRLQRDPSCSGGGKTPLPGQDLQAILGSKAFLEKFQGQG
jgi:2-methylisocitrate lyase-like PEP mutase family enzyme